MNYSLGIPGSDPYVLWSCTEEHLWSKATHNSSNFSMGNEEHYSIILQLLSVKRGHDRSKSVRQSRGRKCSLDVCSSFPTTTIIEYITILFTTTSETSPYLSALYRKHSTHNWYQPCWLLTIHFNCYSGSQTAQTRTQQYLMLLLETNKWMKRL